MGSQEIITIEDDFTLIRFQNDENETFRAEKQIRQGLIQFHFGIKGKAKFIFNQGNYALDLKEEKALLLYNPQKELPLNLFEIIDIEDRFPVERVNKLLNDKE